MSSPKRTKFQIERDRRDIANWYLQGLTQAVIAARLSADDERDYTLTQQQISYDLKRIKELWLKSSLRDFDEIKAQELAKVDRLELEYWAAWERSCEDAETVAQKQKGKVTKRKDKDGEFVAEQPAEVSKTRKGQAGDPRFLAGVQWCINRRCKILGVDAPVKADLTTGGQSIPIKEIVIKLQSDEPVVS